jgi:hypothetical protein
VIRAGEGTFHPARCELIAGSQVENTFEIPFSSAFSGGIAAKTSYLTVGKAQLFRK